MNCEHYVENLTAYLDGELSHPETAELEAHLKACARCAQEHRSLEEATLFVDSQPQPLEPGPELWVRIHSRLSEMPVRSSLPGFLQIFQTSRWAAATAAVAAALVIGLGFLGYIHQREGDNELDRYMSEYIVARESEEQLHLNENAPVMYPAHLEFSSNPFVGETVDASYSNPFRVK